MSMKTEKLHIPQGELVEFINSCLMSGEEVSTQQFYDYLEERYRCVEKYPCDGTLPINNPNLPKNYIDWRYNTTQHYSSLLRNGIRRLKALIRSKYENLEDVLIVRPDEHYKKQFIFKYKVKGFSIFSEIETHVVSNEKKVDLILDSIKKKQEKETKKLLVEEKNNTIPARPSRAADDNEYYEKLIEKLQKLKVQKLEHKVLENIMYVCDLCELKPEGWKNECKETLELIKSDAFQQIDIFKYASLLTFFANFLTAHSIYDNAEELYVEALAIYKEYSDKNKENINYLYDIVSIQDSLVELYNDYHKHNQAISLANQSIELISNHSAIIGEDLRFLNIKVELLHSLAIASHYLHDNDNSIKYCEQIIDIFQASEITNPVKLIDIYIHMAGIYAYVKENTDKSMLLMRNAENIARENVSIDIQFKASLANILIHQAVLYNSTSTRWSIIKPLYEESLKLYRELAEKDPDNYEIDLAQTMSLYIDGLERMARMLSDERMYALDLSKEAISIYEKYIHRQPLVYGLEYALCLKSTANIYLSFLEWNMYKLDVDEKTVESVYETLRICLSTLEDARSLIEAINTDTSFNDLLEEIDGMIDNVCYIESEYEEYIQDE